MKYLITGGGGQLGFDVRRDLLHRDVSESDVAAPSSKELDITDARAVEKYIGIFQPNVIIHCDAYTNVDGSESYK